MALATLGDLMDAGILTCSPTATALALDDFPDRSLFVRTAPSDSLEATQIAAEAERTGALTASVVYLDDPFGRPLAERTIAALESRGIDVPAPIGFSADDQTLLAEAADVRDSEAGVIVLIADAEHGTRLLASLGEVTAVVPGDDPPSIIVNSAMRRPLTPDQIAALADGRAARRRSRAGAHERHAGRAARRLRDERVRLPQPHRPRGVAGEIGRPGRDRP